MTLLIAPIVLAAGIAALGGLATAGLANRRAKKDREYQEELYQKQKTDAEEAARRQDVYNAPSAEKMRMKAAGLSPTMMYGGGAASMSDASIVRMPQHGFTPMADYSGAINSVTSTLASAVMDPTKTDAGFKAGVKNLEANARQADANADMREIQRDEEAFTQDIAKQIGTYGQDKILSTQLRQAELNAQSFLNEINQDTKEEQKKAIVQKAAQAYEDAVQAEWNNQQNPTRKEILGQQLEQAKTLTEIMQSQKNQEFIKATLAQYNIFPTDEWYLRAAALLAGKIKALQTLPEK